MNVNVIAKSDKGVFVAENAKGNYVLLSLGGTKDIKLGDRLSGDFDGRGSLFKAVRNETQRCEVRICLEDWNCPLDVALDQVLHLSYPECIYVGTKCIPTDTPEAFKRLRHEVIAL